MPCLPAYRTLPLDFARMGKPILRSLAFVSLILCLGMAQAPAQFFQFPFGQQQQVPTRPQPQASSRPQAQALPRTPKVETQPEATPSEVTTPYDPDLQRLAEILGALHFLRGICGANEGQKWRDEAVALIEAEAPTGRRHDAMIESFNRGYLGYQQGYRTCTPAAKLVIRRYLEEGSKIARDVTARYAN